MRYNYGKEGSRKDYTPYSCLKIISTTPGVVSCTFRHHRPHSPTISPLPVCMLTCPKTLTGCPKAGGNA